MTQSIIKKSKRNKPLLKLPIIERNCSVDEVSFYENNVTPSIMNTKYQVLLQERISLKNNSKQLINALFTYKKFIFISKQNNLPIIVDKMYTNLPTNTPGGLHVETTGRRPFPRRFNVEFTWCVCSASNPHSANILQTFQSI